MSTSQRSYVASLLDENLGLPKGSLDADGLPTELVDEVCATLSGGASRATDDPFLEKLFQSFLSDLERSELERRGYFARKARWPRGAPYAVCLTHDVDNLSRPLSHVWQTRSRFSSTDLLGHLLGALSLYDNIGRVVREEGRRGYHSSFYFLTTNYPLGRLKEAAAHLTRNGWDVGLHGDFGTHDSLEEMKRSIERFSEALGFKPRGVREHFLKFDFSKTWDVVSAAGFDYDTTVGNNDRLGFKIGLATPFHPPDAGWRASRTLEIPLTLMDTTLWGYLKKDEESGLAEIKRMVEKVREVGGLFTLLWHQEAVRMKGGRLYWSLLDWFTREGCFVASGAEVADWWTRRATPLIAEGGKLSFEGDAPEHVSLMLRTADGRSVSTTGGRLEKTSGDVWVFTVEGKDAKVVVT